MAKRKYENKKLKKYFEKYIQEVQVDDKYKPMLVDILLRRADTFDLSPEDIRQDVISLINNLESISVQKMPEGYEEAWGLYCPKEKEIIISDELFESQPEDEIYQTITHEVYHALSKDEHGNDRIAGGYNMFTGHYNSSLLEAIVEKSSYRAVFGNDKQNNEYFNESARGYPNITFVVDLLEATYGVSEKQFLKNAIMGRERLAEFLASRSGETPQSAYMFLDSIEANYALLHHSLYPFSGEKISEYQRNANISSALTGMYNLCEDKMAERIGRTKMTVQSYDEVDNLNDELRYDHNKLAVIMENRLNYFSQYFDNGIRQNVYNKVGQSRSNTLAKINDINSLIEATPNFSDEPNFLRAFSWAADGKLAQLPPDTLAYYGINLKLDSMLPMTQEIVDRAFYGEKLGPQYDNSKIPKLFKKFKSKDKGFLQTGLDKIKSLFSKKDQKLLTAGGTQVSQDTEPLPITTIFPQLTKEEQEMYNNQVRQAVESTEKSKIEESSKELENEDR